MRLSPGLIGRLVSVYLLGGVGFVAGAFLTLFVSFFPLGLDPAFESGLGERAYGLIPLAGGAILAAFLLYGLLKERLGLPLKASHLWIVSGVTWLPAALAQISAGPLGLLAEPDTVTLIVVAVSVAMGQGVGLWLGRVAPTSQERTA